MSDLDGLRSRYLQTLVKSLKENVEKTSTLELDDLLLTHCALKLEENCRDKCQGSLHLYTKSITAARIKIEQSTSRSQLFPMIVECIPANDEDTVPAAKNNNVAEKHTTLSDVKHKPEPVPEPNYKIDNDVIVIDSSDSEDEGENMEPEREILISVQTVPSVNIRTEKDSN